MAALFAGACVPAARPGAPYPAFAQFEGWEVGQLRFIGETLISEDSLRRVISTHPPRCVIAFLPRALCPGFARRTWRLDLTELARDVARLQLYYRDFGYYGTRVVPAVEPIEARRVEVRFAVAAGDLVQIQSLEIEGLTEEVDTARLRRRLPLAVGDPFRRGDFVAAGDTIRAALVRAGYAYVELLRNYSLDTELNVAEIRFEAVPGPQVRLDTLLVVGNHRLEPPTVQRMLGLREGQVVDLFALSESQRFLYGLDIVRFASVQLAPEGERISPDSAEATVIVRVVEAPRYAVDAAGGYGTLDCFRTTVTGIDRNFLGGARRLELVASASKIGIGHPVGWGFEDSLCRGLRDDPHSDTLNYRLTATFRQPRLFGTLNELQARLHAERQSQFRAFMRQSVGGSVAVTRELARQARGTVTAEVERGYTTADPVTFCAIFGVCTEEARGPLGAPRWSNALTGNLVFDRTQVVGASLRGFVVRGGVDWASPAFGSDDQYLGVLGQVAGYMPVLRPGWVLSGRVQGGAFIDPDQGFIPPQRRFYAGGPSTVRGYRQNTLGPIAYVRRDSDDPDREPEPAPIGGTRSLITSVELRTPSPWFRDFLRLAYFVDAGQVWAPEAAIGPLDVSDLRVTPGVGLRFATPVGPIRFDVGYNPHRPTRGPLFAEDDGDLVVIDQDFAPDRHGFWRRLAFHIAVGQAF